MLFRIQTSLKNRLTPHIMSAVLLKLRSVNTSGLFSWRRMKSLRENQQRQVLQEIVQIFPSSIWTCPFSWQRRPVAGQNLVEQTGFGIKTALTWSITELPLHRTVNVPPNPLCFRWVVLHWISGMVRSMSKTSFLSTGTCLQPCHARRNDCFTK